MRIMIVSAAILFAALHAAAIEPAPIAPAQPTLMTASATACGPALTLHIRTVQFAPVVVDIVHRVPVTETALVKGRIVERTRFIEERRQETMLRAAPGAIIDVPLDGVEVCVFDLNGKPVVPSRLKILLKKEKPVLVSFNGPVDPFFLQTTKPGTLIVQLPAVRLAAPTELLPPAKRTDPNEPPLAPPIPKR